MTVIRADHVKNSVSRVGLCKSIMIKDGLSCRDVRWMAHHCVQVIDIVVNELVWTIEESQNYFHSSSNSFNGNSPKVKPESDVWWNLTFNWVSIKDCQQHNWNQAFNKHLDVQWCSPNDFSPFYIFVLGKNFSLRSLAESLSRNLWLKRYKQLNSIIKPFFW